MSDLATMSDEELMRRIQVARGGSPAPGVDPSTLSDEALMQIINQQQGMPEVNTPPNRVFEGGKAAAKGVAKGLGDVGRGIGILDQLSAAEKAKFSALSDRYPEAAVGEILGQVAPFLVPAAGAAGVASLPVRAALSSLLGATEGAVVTRGQGGTKTEQATAGGVGAVLGPLSEVFGPVVNRGVRAVADAVGLRKASTLLTKQGIPTPEFQAALDKAGINFRDIRDTALAEVRNLPSGADPAQAARLARFKSENINPTAGQVTQDFAQQARESRLESMASGEAGDPLRQRVLEQSLTFEGQIDGFVKSLGVPAKAGETIKEALSGRKALLKTEKNKFYKQITDLAPEVARAPILTDSIIKALPDTPTQRRIKRLAGTQAAALDDLLVEFGLVQDKESVEAFMKANPKASVTPLALGNFEDFRQAINLIERTDQTGAISVLTGPIKTALDEEAALIDGAVRNSGLSDTGVLNTLKEARSRVREIKTEFSPQAISGRLIDTKRDGFTPVIEASQVTDQLLRSGSPIEQTRAVLNNLAKAGPKGAEAIKDLQAATIMQAMEAAMKAPSRKTSGIQTMGGNQFAKALEEIGDEKIALIFKGNDAALNRLNKFKQIALDMQPTAGAVPKGSAPVILDMLATVGGGQVAEAVRVARTLAKVGSDDRAVAAALRGKPEVIENARQFARLYPSLASVIGLGVILNMDEKNAPQR